MERFLPAYVTELTAFVDVARGDIPSPCTVADALEAFRTAEACARSMATGEPGRPRRASRPFAPNCRFAPDTAQRPTYSIANSHLGH